MAQQTINVGTAPNDGTGTPLRTAFQYTNSNFSELYTALGGGSGLPGAANQIIFNNGSSLAGNANLTFNTSLNKLVANNIETAANLLVGTSATITGDLTVKTNVLKVDTTNNRVGVNTASPINSLHVNGEVTLPINNLQYWNAYYSGGFKSAAAGYAGYMAFATNGDFVLANTDASAAGAGSALTFYNRYRISNAGIHTWETVGGVAGTAMTLNSTGLGVGVAPGSGKIAARAGTAATGNSLYADNIDGTYNPWIQIQHSSAGIKIFNSSSFGGSSNNLIFGNGTTSETMRIDATGNVGIGVTPSAWSASFKSAQVGSRLVLTTTGSDTFFGNNFYNDGSYKFINADYATYYDQTTGKHVWGTSTTSGAVNGVITWNPAMTLDASGRLLVGQTSTGLLNINGIDIEGGDSNGGSYIIVNHKLATASGQQYAFFGYNAVKTGDITQNGTTGVLYNTVSDYRLKESVQPLSNGLSRVSSLKPSIYKWKSDGSSGEGFLAHELAEVVPFAVTGEKDAVNEDGSIKAQSVDMSRVIPILVAAIQELAAEVNALKNA